MGLEIEFGFVFFDEPDDATNMSSEMKRQRKWSLVLAGAISLGLVVVFVLMGFYHRNIDVSFSGDGFVRIASASLWSSCRSGSSCKIVYQPNGGEAGSVLLWQDFADKPIIVMLAADKTLLCLYNFDVDLRLLRIDPAKSSKPFSSESRLDAIVCASPWYIESGTTNDWQEMLDYIKKLPSGAFKSQSVPTFDLGIISLHGSPESIQQRMEGQVELMHRFGASQWPVPNH